MFRVILIGVVVAAGSAGVVGCGGRDDAPSDSMTRSASHADQPALKVLCVFGTDGINVDASASALPQDLADRPRCDQTVRDSFLAALGQRKARSSGEKTILASAVLPGKSVFGFGFLPHDPLGQPVFMRFVPNGPGRRALGPTHYLDSITGDWIIIAPLL